MLLLGGAAGLGQVPFALPWATLAALAVIMWHYQGVSRGWSVFALGWLFGIGYFALTLHWIVEPFQVDVARHGWMAPFALIFMAGGLALFWGAAFALARRIGPGLWPLVVVWTGAEIARSVVLTGFPWALIGHVWSETPLVQIIAVTGQHALTLMTLALVAVVVWAAGFGWSRMLALPVTVCAGLVAGWLWLDPGPAPEAVADAPVIRLVQPNVPQAEKWDPDLMPVHMRRLLDLSGGGAVPAVVVWPETAVPYLLEYSADVLELAVDATRGAPLITGIQRREGERYYNALALVDRTGQVADLYDKVHLVPFGEYVPFGEVLSRFGISGLAASEGGGFSAGPEGKLIQIPGVGMAWPLICYEGIFAPQVASAPTRPRLLLLVTNDAWFGALAGPYQHFALGRLRAIEQGLPMVRAANTGVSAVIDGKGRVLGQLDLNTAGALDIPLPAVLSPTIYARLADWPVIVLLCVLLSGVLIRARGVSD